MADEGWERRALEALANDIVVERRRARRWSIFFKVLTIGFVVLGLLVVAGIAGTRGQLCIDRCTAVVHVEGEIDRESRASAENVIEGLHAAFEHPGTKGVLLRINSPGGSPVQSNQIYAEVRRLRAKHPQIPLHAVVEDMAASGAYYIAASADRIYVDPSSLVGSIGVIIDSFGLVGTIEQIGAERRVNTAGDDKEFLDPFLPLSENHRAYAQDMLDEVHKVFIGAVRDGRGSRLKETPELYSGLVWTGQRALDLGLADAFGSVDSVARDVIGAEEIVDVTPQEDFTQRLARRFGAEVARFTLGALRSGALSMPKLR